MSVDDGSTLLQLQDGVVALQTSIARVDAAMRDPLLTKDADGHHLWSDVDDAMHLGQATIESLKGRVPHVPPTAVHGRGRLVKTCAQHVRAHHRTDETVRLGAQIQSHHFTMQVILQTLRVHMICISTHVDTEELRRGLENLLGLLHGRRTYNLGQDASSQRIQMTHERLQASAEGVAAHASDVLSSTSLDRSGRGTTQTARRGSGPEPSLTAEQIRRILSWVACDPERDSSIPAVPRHPVMPSVRSCGPSTASQPGCEALHRSDSRMTLLSEASDEDDVDLKIANTYLAEARRSANARHHEAAETFYRKFLQRAIELGDRWDGPRIENVRLDLAVACYEQDKLGDAMKLTDALLDHAAEQDEDRERVLTASHLKALILLRQGFLCSALRQCKHSTKIRRRTAGRDLAYYESIALIAFIYELQGDEIDARTCTALLPPGFSRPSFKPPDPSVRPADTTYADSALQVSTISDGVLPGLNCGLDERAMQRESSTMRQEDAGEDLMSGASSNHSSSCTSSTRASSVPSPDSASRTSLESEAARYQRLPLPQLPPRPGSRSLSRMELSGSPKSASDDVETELRRTPSVVLRLFPTTIGGSASGAPNPAARPGSSPELAARQSSSPTARRTDDRRDGQELQRSRPERVVNRPDLTPQARRDALKFLETKDISLAKPQDWREQYFRAAETGHRHAVHLLLTDWQYHKTSRFGLKSKEMVNHQKIHVDTTDDQQRTALHLAASNGHADVVQLLLDWGASDTKRMAPDTSSKVVEKSSKAGKTALECAIAKGHRAVVKVFREKNCVHDSVDSNGWSLMHHAASACDTKIVSLLLTQRLDPDRRTTTGRTPLHIAAQHGRQTTLELLLQRRNPEVDAPDHQGHTALSLAVRSGHLPCIKTLHAAGAQIRTANLQKTNLLHVAAREGHAHLLSYLVFKGADIEAGDSLRRSPLHYAALFDHPNALDTLLGLGADVSAVDEEGNTALHAAAGAGHPATVEALRAQGLSLAQANRLGRTPLHLAAMGGHHGIVVDLIAGGCNVQQLDKSGLTAASYARAKGHMQVAELLELHGAVG